MKKRLLTFITIFAFITGSAQAQQLFAGGGLNVGFVNGVVVFGLRGVFGADEIGGRRSAFGLRGTFDFIFTPGIDLGIGLDAYAKIGAGAVDPYFGAGARVFFVNGFEIAIQGLAGVDFSLSREVGLYVEFQPGVLIVPNAGTAFIASLSAGVKAKF